NSLGQRVFHDVHVWPEGLEELVLRDDASAVPNEVQQQLERLRRQVDVLSGSEQTALGPVKGEVAEPNDRDLLHEPGGCFGGSVSSAIRQRVVKTRDARVHMITNNQRAGSPNGAVALPLQIADFGGQS